MKTRSFWLLAALAASYVLMVLPGWAFAAELRSGDTALVAAGETVDDDLFAGGGRTATISGRVTGDAYVASETVIVNGSVDGDLIAAAQQVIVDGTIGGNVRAAGANVTINGSVGRSVTSLAQHVTVTSNGRIGGSVTAAGQTIDTFGQVGRGLTVGGGTLQLAGNVGGPVKAYVETLAVAPTARVQGGLDYQANQEAALPSGAVSGPVHFAPQPERERRPAPLLNGLFDLGALVGLVGTFLVGALAIVLLPRAAARAAELGRQQPWQSFGLGLLVLCGLPIVAIIVGVTLVGIPLAITLFALYVLGLLLAWPAAALVIGTQLARLVRPEQPLPVLGTLAIGLIVLHLLTHVPFVGGLLFVCSVMFGLGLIVQAARRWRRPAPPAPSDAMPPLEAAAAA